MSRSVGVCAVAAVGFSDRQSWTYSQGRTSITDPDNYELPIDGEPLPAAAPVFEDFENDAKPEQKTLIVIMYHKILQTRKGKYIVTCEQPENGLVELKKRGYESVFPGEIIAYREGRGDYPQSPY